MHKFIIKFLIVLFGGMAASHAFGENSSHVPGKCIIPAPDGSDAAMASLANIHGKIIEKTGTTITIQKKQRHQNTHQVQ